MRAFVAVALLLLAGSAHAQQVYKCVSKAGKVSYLSWPCPKDQQVAKTVPYAPEPVRRYVPPTPSPRRYYSGGGGGFQAPTKADQERQARKAACASARSEYDRVQADFKLNRNVQRLRDLESQLRQYCD